MAVLRNVEVQWACVQKPNTKFTPVWSVDAVLTKEQRKEVEAEIKALYKKGMKVPKVKDVDGKMVFKFKRKTHNAAGEENNKPVVRDARNRDTDVLIGNGSICNIMYSVYEWNNSFGSGLGVDLKGIQVIDLVPYSDDSEDFEDLGEDTTSSDDEEDFEVEDDPF